MKTWKRYVSATLLLTIALFMCSSLQNLWASPGFEVHPSIDVRDFIVYAVIQGNTSTTTVFPSTFKITWSGELDTVVNGWWCPAFWEDTCKPEKYRYEITTTTYTFAVDPPQIVEVNGVRILLTYFLSLSANAYASKTWYGYLEEHVKVIVSVYAYGRVDKPPNSSMALDLGGVIQSMIGRDRIPVQYNINVVRTYPESASYSLTGTVDLLLDNLKTTFYRLYTKSVSVTPTGYTTTGSFGKSGYIGILPKGDIRLTLCLEGPGSYTLEGTVSYYNSYSSAEAKISVTAAPGGGCGSTTLSNVVLVPGNYTGNNKFMLTLRTGSFTASIVTDTEIVGAMTTASTPIVIVYQEDGTWKARIFEGLDYRSYNYNSPASVQVSGSINIGGASASFSCPSKPFNAPDQLNCNVTLGQLQVDMRKVSDCKASVNVVLSLESTTYSDTADVTCSILSPASTHGLVASLYDVLSRASLVLLLAMVILYTFEYIMVMLGRPIFGPEQVMHGLMTAVALVVIVNITPYFYWLVLSGLYAIPDIQSVLARTPVSSPSQILGLQPSQAVAVLMNYYDMTLNELKMDYKTWFEEQMNLHIFARLAIVGIFVGILASFGLAMLITGHSFAVGPILSPLVSYIFIIISFMLSLIPLAGVVNALIGIAEIIIALAAVSIIVLLMLGLVMAVIPSPLSQRLSEDFIGAGLLYLLGVPSLAPVVYVLYAYTKSSVAQYIQAIDQAITPINIPAIGVGVGMNILVPVTPIMRMMSYVAMATMVTLSIIFVNAYILSRTGVMSGLGEAIMRVVRR